MNLPDMLKRDGKPDLAYRRTDAHGDGVSLPSVMFLGGFSSDMLGTKAQYLEDQCKERGQAYIRFDYSGHGESGGVFEQGCISDWADDALAILDKCTSGPVVLAGSSMGGWLAFLVALARQERIKGVVGIAAAPDFTRWIEDAMSAENHAEMAEKGFFTVPNEYSDEPYIFTQKLLEDGRHNCLLEDGGIDLDVPVRLVQGMKDADVEWQTAYRIQNALSGEDVQVFPVENGDHRLSKPDELKLIDDSVRDVSGC